jgi:hypothetical protein
MLYGSIHSSFGSISSVSFMGLNTDRPGLVVGVIVEPVLETKKMVAQGIPHRYIGYFDALRNAAKYFVACNEPRAGPVIATCRSFVTGPHIVNSAARGPLGST